jgi:hypothetical protein
VGCDAIGNNMGMHGNYWQQLKEDLAKCMGYMGPRDITLKTFGNSYGMKLRST